MAGGRSLERGVRQPQTGIGGGVTKTSTAMDEDDGGLLMGREMSIGSTRFPGRLDPMANRAPTSRSRPRARAPSASIPEPGAARQARARDRAMRCRHPRARCDQWTRGRRRSLRNAPRAAVGDRTCPSAGSERPPLTIPQWATRARTLRCAKGLGGPRFAPDCVSTTHGVCPAIARRPASAANGVWITPHAV